MAWEARSGLKRVSVKIVAMSHDLRLNGLGGPFGIETVNHSVPMPLLAGLNGLGGPFGIETGNYAIR